MQFLKSYWMFILLGVTIVIVAIIGYVAVVRLSLLDTEPDITTAPGQGTTETTSPSDPETTPNRGELSFSIDEETTTDGSSLPTGLACIELVAQPLEGSVPLTVTFTGIAKDPSADTLTFDFDFGDETSQSVDIATTDKTGVESQDISHTYTEPGKFLAILTIISSSGSVSSVSCQVPISAGGVGEITDPISTPRVTTPGVTITPAITPNVTITPAIGGTNLLTTTPAPTTIAAVPISPTIAITTAPTKIPTAIPTVGQGTIDQPIVPQAGGLLPTAAATIGGIAIIILAVLL